MGNYRLLGFVLLENVYGLSPENHWDEVGTIIMVWLISPNIFLCLLARLTLFFIKIKISGSKIIIMILITIIKETRKKNSFIPAKSSISLLN